ncbi:MAG TPA: hypothetical protein VGH87_27590 [Polyangiaceae bacterium]|nr:hypothetical protein [Polyangiaceae bacterium]
MGARRKHSFRAVVTGVEYMHRASGTVWITHFDPKFVARITVLRGEDPFVEGSEHQLAIHSVAQTFFDEPKGVAFDFELTRSGKSWTLSARRASE